MAGRHSAKYSSNAKAGRCGAVVGGALGAFVAAAAMATGSAVTAAPAKADFDAFIDPIVTSLSDAIAGFDPAAATDLTSWADSLLSSLNSVDLALPSATEPAAAAAAVPAGDPTTGTYDIPITIQEDTEPTVQASIDGGSDQTLLVDTGSSGLVVPWDYLGSNDFSSLETLFSLGFPTGISESGYSGGVDYIYLEYNDATVNYGDGALTTTSTPIDVEILSWPTASGSPSSFEQFLQDDDSTGILGIGDSSSDGGPTVSPLQADGYEGVTVDIPNVPTSLDEPDGNLIVEPSNPFQAIDTVSGAPISSLYETITTGGSTTGSTVSDDIDSGGVYGTIPSALSSDVAPGSVITVYSSQGGTELYSYTVGTDTPDGTSEAPGVTSGTSIDSGIEPFLGHPIYIDYTGDTQTFDN
jgi:hypothetical protein